MGNPTVINYIDISGEDVLFDDLPPEKKAQIAEIIQDRMMNAIGYRRKMAAGSCKN